MRHLFLLFLWVATAAAAPTVTGPTSAIEGIQSVFTVNGTTSKDFTWIAQPPDGGAPREVNQGRVALVTSWQGRPGRWQISIRQADGVQSNMVAVDVLSSAAPQSPAVVNDPTAVVAWTEEIQAAPRSATAADLRAVSAMPTRRPLPVVEAPAPAEVTSSAGSGNSTVPSSVPAEPAVEETIPTQLYPSSDDIVDIANLVSDPEIPGAIRNPFAKVQLAAVKPRELAINLSAVVIGPRSSAIVNDKVHSIGDQVEGSGLRVTDITRDGVVLRISHYFVHVPLERVTTVRLPQN